MQDAASKFELRRLFFQVEFLTLHSWKLKDQILNRVLEDALITVIYLRKCLLRKEGPHLNLTLAILLHAQEGRYVSIPSPDYWNVIINYHILPYSIVIDPHIVNTEPEDLLLLHHPLKATIAIRDGIERSDKVIWIVEIPPPYYAFAWSVIIKQHKFLILEELLQPHPTDLTKFCHLWLAVA